MSVNMFDDWEFWSHVNYLGGELAQFKYVLYPIFSHTSLKNQPRHYPYRFGLRMLRILPQLQADAATKHFPEIPEGLEAVAIYQAQQFDDLWGDACVLECIEYIRGNKYLKIPNEWEQVLLPK